MNKAENKTYTFTFTSDDIVDALTSPYGDRPNPLRDLADDQDAIKHIASKVIGFAIANFADDVIEAGYDYVDYVKED